MGSELTLGGYGDPEDGRGWLTPRASKAQRALQQREQRDAAKLVYEARKQEFTAALRKRMTDNAIHDVTDVAELAQELAAGDQFLAAMLIPIVQEFQRQTVRDIRTFGQGL